MWQWQPSQTPNKTQARPGDVIKSCKVDKIIKLHIIFNNILIIVVVYFQRTCHCPNEPKL